MLPSWRWYGLRPKVFVPRRSCASLAVRPLVAALACMLLAAACGSSPTPQGAPRAPSATPAPPSSAPAAPSATPTGGPTAEPTKGVVAPSPSADMKVVLSAREDLARRLGVGPEAVAVRSVEAVTWPDASLGCPQPGVMYAQVLTPGYRVILQAGERAYEYHTDETKTVVLCAKEAAAMPDSPTPGPVEPGLETLVAMAREDLARRLGVPIEQIEVLEARSVVWPDASLGCPQPGMSYAQVLVEGALVRLRAGGQVYAYHSGGRRAPFLCEQSLERKKETPPQLELLPPTSRDN